MMLISRIDSAKEEKKMGIIFFKRLRMRGMMKALRATPASKAETGHKGDKNNGDGVGAVAKNRDKLPRPKDLINEGSCS